MEKYITAEIPAVGAGITPAAGVKVQSPPGYNTLKRILIPQLLGQTFSVFDNARNLYIFQNFYSSFVPYLNKGIVLDLPIVPDQYFIVNFSNQGTTTEDLRIYLGFSDDGSQNERRMISGFESNVAAGGKLTEILQAPNGFNILDSVAFTAGIAMKLTLYDQDSRDFLLQEINCFQLGVYEQGLPIDKPINPDQKFTLTLVNTTGAAQDIGAGLVFRKY